MKDIDTAAAVANYLRSEETAQGVQQNLVLASETDPAFEAELRRVSARTGIPLESARAYPDVARRQAQLAGVDSAAIAQRFPATAQFLGKLENAQIAHDDVENLTSFEGVVLDKLLSLSSGLKTAGEFVTDAGKRVYKGAVYDLPAGFWGAVASPLELVGQGLQMAGAPEWATPAVIPRGLAEMARQGGQGIDLSAPQGTVAKGLASGFESLGQNLPLLPFGIATQSYKLPTLLMSLASGGSSYLEATDQGAGPLRALSVAAPDAVAEYATEQYGMKALFDIPAARQGVGALFKGIANFLAKEGVGEQVATVWQDFNNWQVLHPEKSPEQFMDERPDAAAQTLIATLVGGGGQVALVGGMTNIIDALSTAKQAQPVADVLGALNKIAEATKVRERDAATAEAFFQSVLGEGLTDVWITPQALAQSGQGSVLAQVMPEVAQQIEEAAAGGHDVRLPIAGLMAQMAGPNLESLIPHVSAEPGGFSQLAAHEYLQSGAVQELEAEVERMLQMQDASDAFQQSADAVRAGIKAQLDTAARFTPQVNDAYAALVGNFYAATAARLGTTPEALLQRYPLKIGAENVSGMAFDQAKDGGAPRTDTSTETQPDGSPATRPSGPIVGRITGEEIAPRDADIKTLRDAARQWYNANLRNTSVVNAASGRTVEFKKAGKAFSASANPEKLQLFAVLRDVVAQGEIRSTTAPNDKTAEPGVKAYHWLTATVELNGKPQEVGVTLREDNNGHLYYNHNPLEKKAPTDPRRSQPAHKAAGYTDGDAFNQSIEPAGEDINLHLLNQTPQAPRGSFNPATLQITLLKGADLSTFLHESGHFFLEVLADMASQPNAPAQVQQDMSTTLQWFGVKDLAEWQSLDFEEKRSYHEQFARGFEAYLFEGKAPSIEVQGLFQRFRAWLVGVYKDLKALNVELTPEVRGVFDRLLATDTQIALAEQGRSLLPLFESAQQAGMTPDEFAAYQALGQDATAEAAQDLQSRGLRDMKWLHNARGRIIRQLQKEAAAARSEAQMAVRGEVMSQPLYRAWTFLTGKIGVDDKVQPAERPPKSDPNIVDERQDSLFVAIAKLGGLNKDEVMAAWGTDPADKPASGVFGKPVWRLEGGLSIDAMAESLAQYGYLTPDEHGKVDVAELERLFDDELRGSPQYSSAMDPAYFTAPPMAGEDIINPQALAAGRIDQGALEGMGLPVEVVNTLKARRMVAKAGLHPDIVADLFGFTSGDELVRKLAAADTPKAEIEGLTDARMLEEHGELASEEAIDREADKAVHNDLRARMVAAEVNALAKATGQRRVLASAAKAFAQVMVARLKIRNLRPGQYAGAEVRAAKAAEKASRAGDLAKAAAEKRNQLVQNYATRAAYDAQDEVSQGLRYLRKFSGGIKGLDLEYADQIAALLERFDLRSGQTNRGLDRRATLAEWIKAQRDVGLEPDIPAELENEALRKSYRDMTLEEFRGLVDTVKQIDHLGRLKHKLLTARDQRAYAVVRDEITASIKEHAQGRRANTRTPTTNMGRTVQGLKRFWAAHIKAATWARVMDGGKDGGPVWEYFIRSANESGDRETTMRAEATAKLAEIMGPVFRLGKMGGKGQYFPSIGRSLNREARIAIALNVGNEGNLQRLMDGEGWTMERLAPVLQSLSAQEWQAVQAVWDHLDSYRPLIAEKERRVYGKEPAWVEAKPFDITTADGQRVSLRGGYYPVKYDPAASQRAEEHADAEAAKRQLQGAYTTATTRRSFTKARAEEVKGRPLLYTLAGMYSGVNDVIHDLAWHEWLIDANRLMRSNTIDKAIREHYGPEVKQQFKSWVQDVAEGDKGADAAVDMALSRLRQGVSAAGLGFNVMSALIQPLGITQSITRVGAPWIARGVTRYLAGPVGLTREVVAKSSFMENRARTRFRELNELRNKVQDQTAFQEMTGRYAYFLMMRCQQMVDVPTWWGAYEKAIGGGNDEDRAVALADQAVIDAQGGGQTKDLSAIERGGPAQKLFTVFYSFMNTALNAGVDKTMSADTPAKRARLAVDYAMLYTVPAVLGYFLKAAITPGDDGEDDMEGLARKLLAAQLDYLMGLMVVVREFGEAAKTLAGANDMGRDYTGPAGLRAVVDSVALAKQAHQGEFDTAFRKAAVNVVGDFTGLPAAQVNRSITGAEALADGETENPAALVFGFRRQR